MTDASASKLWRFQPVARADDPRWLDAPRYSNVLVRAETVGEAVRVAERGLGGSLVRASDTVGNETASDRTGFGDTKLYRAQEVAPHDVGQDASGAPEVLESVP